MSFTVTANSPSAGHIAWAGVHLVYNGVDYAIANGSTNQKFVFWRLATPGVFQTSNTHPSLTKDDAIVFLNKSGVPISVLTATAMDGDLVVPGTVTATAIATDAIAASHIQSDAVQARHIIAGAITAEKIAVTQLSAISANLGTMTAGNFTLDATGFIRGGATSPTSGTGFWMGNDGGTYKFRLGTAAGARMTWDGSTFNIFDSSGNLTISSGVVDYSLIYGKPASLSAINATEGAKLSGVETGATRNVNRGEWATGVAYAKGDIVTRNGSSWTADVAHTAATGTNEPPTLPTTSNSFWKLSAAKGDAGINGTRTAVLEMYRWSASAPTTFPAGSSTYTWATGQFTAPATLNSWALTPPAPVAGQTLWVVRQVYADSQTTATSAVTWAANTAVPAGGAGSNGSNGSNGTRTAILEVYQWAAAAPATFPAGSSTYTWATGAFTAPATPNGWSLTPGAPVAGHTLWACSVAYSDTATSATSAVTWNNSVAYAVGAAGSNGSNAKLVYLTASSQVFAVSKTAVPTPSSITLTATGQNLTGSPEFAIISGTAILTETGNTRALAYSSMTTDAVTVQVTWDSMVDTITIVKVREGADGSQGPQGPTGANGTDGANGIDGLNGLTVIVSNEAHTLPASSAGAVSSYANSGTTVQVFEGSTALTASASATASAFRIGTITQSPASTITVGGVSYAGTTATVAQHSAMVTGTDLVILTIPVTIYRANGTSVTVNKIQTLTKSKVGATGATGATGARGLNFSEAKSLYNDPTFQTGANGLSIYNNSGNGTVTHAWVARLADSPYTDSGFNLEIANTGTASPGIGGFTHFLATRANAVFVQRFVAKVPVGYTLSYHNNSFGDGATAAWLTSNAGTGKFEEYLVEWRCGATGTFSSIGFIALNGTAGTSSVPVKWWLAYSNIFDFTAIGFSTVVGQLSNESHTVPTDSAGNNGNFTGASTTLTIYNGVIDDSANWAVTANAVGVTGSLSGRTYTVTNISGDTGYVDLTATRGGFSTVVKRFTLAKSKAGVTGATGAQGPQGVQGPVGPTGATLYTWLKYADSPTSGMSDDPTGKTYVGLAYNKTTATESLNYADYSWSLIKGADGVQGPAGANGVTTYTWVKYGTSATGAGISDDPAGKTYIGLAYNKTTATESTDPADYTWSLIKGADGAQGPAGPAVVLVSNRPASFTSTDGDLDGAQANIVFTANVSGISSPTYAWSFSGLQTNPTASATSTQAITAAQFGTSKSAIVTVTVNGTIVDKMTIVRLERSTAAAGATVGADNSNFRAGAGINLIPNASLLNSVSPWTSYINTGAGRSGSSGLQVNANGAPKGYGSAYLSITGPVSSDYNDSLHTGSFKVPCAPGERIELQTKVQVFRGNARLECAFFDSNGNPILFTAASDGVIEAVGDTAWSTNLADFVHLWGFATAPANAASVYLEVRVKRTTTSMNTDLYVTQPYIGKATANQSGPTQWTNSQPYITSGNASTYIANAAIGAAQIGSIALVGTSNFSVKTATAGARMEMDSRVIKIFDTNGALRVQIGDLTA